MEIGHILDTGTECVGSDTVNVNTGVQSLVSKQMGGYCCYTNNDAAYKSSAVFKSNCTRKYSQVADGVDDKGNKLHYNSHQVGQVKSKSKNLYHSVTGETEILNKNQPTVTGNVDFELIQQNAVDTNRDSSTK